MSCWTASTESECGMKVGGVLVVRAVFFFARRLPRISRILAVLNQEKVINATPEVLRIARSQVLNPL